MTVAILDQALRRYKALRKKEPFAEFLAIVLRKGEKLGIKVGWKEIAEIINKR